MNNKWLNLCFDMAEAYIPQDKESYNEGYRVRERFNDISEHINAATEYFIAANTEKSRQERIIYMFLYLGIGYNAVGDYEKSMAYKTRALEIQ